MAFVETQDFVPEDQWPSVSVMLDGFGEQTLPASTALAGTKLSFKTADGALVEYAFEDDSTLSWSAATSGKAKYKAIEARAGIFLVDFVRGEDKSSENVTLIWDRNTGAVTTGSSRLVDIDGRTRAITEFDHSSTNGSNVIHERSADLVGKRIFYRYSDVETYEHIYLNKGTFTWHCIRGGEVGLADTERCATWKVAEDLYIFFWTEKVMTVEAVLVVDLKEQRSIGRMFGWDETLNNTLVLPFNSRLSVLNRTVYPEDISKS